MNIITISASLRQHGLGIASSSVNICYKLLAKVRMRTQQLFSLKILLLNYRQCDVSLLEIPLFYRVLGQR
jgi:hypothetical protein